MKTPLSILELSEDTIITDEHGRYIIIDHTTGIVRDIIHNLMGAYCYYHQQTEWAKELGQAISERTYSLDKINLEGLRDSVKKALIGLIASMTLALDPPMAFVEIINYGLAGQGLTGLNMVAYTATIAYTNSKLNITDSIKEFIIEHQTYLQTDLTQRLILPTLLRLIGKVGGNIILGPIAWCMYIGEGVVIFRDHYLPKEYWKYISYHRSWYDGYELRAYVGEDHCIHYVEIPKNPDGSLRWDEAVYIWVLHFKGAVLERMEQLRSMEGLSR